MSQQLLNSAQAINQVKTSPRFKAYYLNQGKPEIFTGVEVIRFSLNESRLEVLFQPGYVFGRQWLEMSEIEKAFEFEHCETKYRIFFAPEDMTEQEIRAKLIGNYL